jgi:hypothetical protein
MEAAFVRCQIPSNWKVLYKAAIVENDRSIGSQRAAEAERAVLARERELFYGGDGTLEEKEALEDALYTLRALKSAWEHSEAS